MAVELAILAILVTILVAVLGAFGAILKLAYDTASNLGVTMHGDPNNGDDGFIQESKRRHEELEESQHEVYSQLVIQGRLLSELTYALSNISDQLDEEDDVDVDIDVERIHDLHDQKRDDNFDD